MWNGSSSKYQEGTYCSQGCWRKAKEARASSRSPVRGASLSNGDLTRALKLVGIALMGLVSLFTVLCYTFPKFLKGKNIKFLYAYIILWAVLIVFALIYFLILRPRMGA
jgi:hypothetical protein